MYVVGWILLCLYTARLYDMTLQWFLHEFFSRLVTSTEVANEFNEDPRVFIVNIYFDRVEPDE